MENLKHDSLFIKIFKGVGIAFLFTILCLTIFSILLVYTNMSESLIQPVVIVVTGISILVGSFIANKKMTKHGIVNGIIIGTVYIGLIYLISSIIREGDFSINLGTIIMIITGIIGGAIGGIIGVNIN